MLEQLLAFVVLARPSPEILTMTIRLALVQYTGADSPHDNGKDHRTDGDDGVVHTDLLCPLVTTLPVAVKDDEARHERDGSNDDKKDLWPGLGAGSPGWKHVPWWQRFRCIEDGECSGKHRKDDQRAAEVDTPKHHLGHPDSELDLDILRLLLV